MVAQNAEMIRAAPTTLAERRMRFFVRDAWPVVEPAVEFQPNWHIDAICAHLEAVAAGQIRNLLITMPPRTLKSLTVSVFFPAWRWITAPGERFLYASYSSDLATDHSLATRRVIESDWYQDRWGDRVVMAQDQNLKTRFENTERGARVATSVGGTVTGKGGDYVIVDDPLSAADASSDAALASVVRWYDQVLSTRLNDPKTGARIVVMQRLHELDLAGHILEQGGYTHLNLPMEYEPDAVQWTGFGDPDPRTEAGQLLAPERIGPKEVADFKVRLGSRGYAGQYQQRPSPAEGAILKREWWRYWRGPLPEFEWIVQSWDTAFKTGRENDFSACITLGVSGGAFYVLDRWHDRVEFPELERAVIAQHAKWLPDEILVEDAASGQSLIQQLQREDGGVVLPIVPFKPDRDKIARVNAVSPYVEGGRVHLPADVIWRDDFIEETAVFPAGAHDDQVDAFTMAMIRMAARENAIRPIDPVLLAAFAGLPG